MLLVVHESRRDFEAGQFEASRAVASPTAGVQLIDAQARGSFTSPAIRVDGDFSGLVLSVNFAGGTPESLGMVGLVSVRAGHGWSPWFRMLRWGTPAYKTGQMESESGRVDVDLLNLEAPAHEARYAVAWQASEPAWLLRRVALSFKGPTSPAPERESAGSATRLPVPFLSQWEVSEHPAARVCSPTCLAMIARFYGADLSVDQVAGLAYDPDHALYGNWSANVLAMSLLGFRAVVEHASGLYVLDTALRSGEPVIASIAFREHELAGAPMASSNGHLVVVAGLTDRGDYWVRDPAAKGRDDWREYSRSEFGRAWLGHGGVCYRIRPEAGS